MEEDTIVIYSAPGHMNTMSLLAKFISKHHPKIPIVILCTADADSAAAVSGVPSITYRRLPTPALPPDITDNCVELMFEIPRLNNANLREALHEISQKARIRAFIIDFFCNSGFEVSESMEIPTYHYFSAGTAVAIYSLCYAEIHETITVDLGEFKDFIEFPGLPLIYSLDFPREALLRQSIFNKHMVCLSKYMRKSRGFIVNAFDALDYRAKEAISNGLCLPNEPTPPVYFMGPLVGDVEGGAKHECLSWLDKQPSKSVVFLCFGRRGVFSAEQIKETAIGLEKSGHRFLWAVRSPMDGGEADLDAALPEGFMERTKERGLVVKSWAPQREVLSHDSVGGFVTHCGRSSIFEGLWFGVPMIGWPMDAEQRMNRTVVVEDMRVVLPVEGAADEFVTAAELEKRVRELMDSESKTGKEVRRRVGEMKSSARKAMAENGSSVVDLHKFLLSATLD
nr:flavonoid O-glycosyltransferase UGT88D13 [Scutellaria baicalensis]